MPDDRETEQADALGKELEAMGAVYLSDGAYVGRGSYTGEIIVFTTDGLRITNQVHLDPTAVGLLIRFVNRRRE